MAKIDLTGQRFGKLLVLEEVKDKRASNGAIIWRCKCDCGKEVEIVGTNLRKKKNHIRLNRISYKEYNDLTLERILNPV